MKLNSTAWMTKHIFIINCNDGEDQIIVMKKEAAHNRYLLRMIRTSDFLANGSVMLAYTGNQTGINKWMGDALAKCNLDEKAVKNIIAHHNNPQLAVKITYGVGDDA